MYKNVINFYNVDCDIECGINNYMWNAYSRLLNESSIKIQLNVPVDYSFQKEINKETVIHLENKISESVKILNKVIQSDKLMKNYKLNSFQWLDLYEKSTVSNFDKFLKEEFFTLNNKISIS